MALCGANLNLDAITSASTDLKTSLKSKLGGAGTFTSASDLKSLVDGKASTLTAQVQGLLPTLPTVPPLSFQSELTALAGINLSTPQGLLDYQSKLSSITNNFGDALSSSGFSLDDLVSQFAPSIPGFSTSADVCKDCPNFEIPSGATEAFQSAQNSVLAQAEGALEKLADIQTNTDFNADISALSTKASDIIASPEFQSKASADISSATARISSDIQTGASQVTESAQAVISEVAPVLDELSGKTLSTKIPQNFKPPKGLKLR